MPGKKGVKLIPRRSTSGKYHSIKSLVFTLLDKKPTISKEEVEKIIKKEYPKAKFFARDGKGGHFTWYKSQWNRMKLDEERFNIKDRKEKEKLKDESKDEKKDVKRKVEKVAATTKSKAKSNGKGGKHKTVSGDSHEAKVDATKEGNTEGIGKVAANKVD